MPHRGKILFYTAHEGRMGGPPVGGLWLLMRIYHMCTYVIALNETHGHIHAPIPLSKVIRSCGVGTSVVRCKSVGTSVRNLLLASELPSLRCNLQKCRNFRSELFVRRKKFVHRSLVTDSLGTAMGTAWEQNYNIGLVLTCSMVLSVVLF